MKYSDPQKLFKDLLMREQTPRSGGNVNSNIIKLQRGKSYSFRLLWLPSETREYPMINQYVHRVWDENAIGSKDISVICPTSQYDLGDSKAGFDTCPICSRMSALYKAFSEGSKTAGELYKKFKRTLRGYVPVYVVNGPEEDKHKVKILPYTISFKNFFDEKIFGIKKKSNNDETEFEENNESNMIGIDAFMYYDPKTDSVITTGHNFLVNVDSKRIPTANGQSIEMNDYRFEFAMKNTDISAFGDEEVTPELFKSLANKLHFDDEFFKMHDIDELDKFLSKYLDGVDEIETPTTKNRVINESNFKKEPVKPAETFKDDGDEDEMPLNTKTKKAPAKPQPITNIEEDDEFASFEKSKEAHIPSKNDDENDSDSSPFDDDIDIDDILKDLN